MSNLSSSIGLVDFSLSGQYTLDSRFINWQCESQSDSRGSITLLSYYYSHIFSYATHFIKEEGEVCEDAKNGIFDFYYLHIHTHTTCLTGEEEKVK